MHHNRFELITGAKSGIGKAASIAPATPGATLVMLCCDKALGDAAVHVVRESLDSPKRKLRAMRPIFY